MSANVGLTTPRGSGTSGYVQRNLSFLKPRDGTFSKPPVPYDSDHRGEFKQRQPDKQILEHEKRRAIEVRLVEERDRMEEENEALEEDGDKDGDDDDDDDDADSDGDGKAEKPKRKVKLSEDEIEEKITALREEMTRELEEEMAGGGDPYGRGKRKFTDSAQGGGQKGRKQFKTYQVHEQAEAKIEESERLRRALGIRRDEDQFAHEEVGSRNWDRRPRDRGGERGRGRDDTSYERSRYDDREARWRR